MVVWVEAAFGGSWLGAEERGGGLSDVCFGGVGISYSLASVEMKGVLGMRMGKQCRCGRIIGC